MDDAELRAELLELLGESARRSSEDLARLTGVEEARVRATVDALEEAGVIRGYQAVVDWERADGADERVEALVELNVTLDRETSYDDIARRLVKFDEVRSLRLVSGDYDFALGVEGDSMGEVSRFVSEQVAPVPEVTQTVTHYVMDTYKEGGIEFEGRDDDRLSVTP
jgi:DNA-binding Lrp family transcriptional regulator